MLCYHGSARFFYPLTEELEGAEVRGERKVVALYVSMQNLRSLSFFGVGVGVGVDYGVSPHDLCDVATSNTMGIHASVKGAGRDTRCSQTASRHKKTAKHAGTAFAG